MLFIRQNATHKVVLGPAVAVGDGFTPVTTLDVSSADEAEAILHDNGTVVDISGYTWAAITTADGYYHLTLQSGISGTVGHLTIVINDDSLCLPLRADFTVLEEGIYDSLFAASAAGFDANQRVDVGQWLGTACATPTTAGVPEVDVTYIAGAAVSASSAQLGVNVVNLGGSAVQAASGYIKVSEGTGTGQIDLTSGRPGIDWAKVSNPTSTVGLSNTTVGICTTNTDMVGTDNAALAATALTNATWTDVRAGYLDNVNGHTPQTGDTYAALPTNFSDLSITVTTGRIDVDSVGGTSQTANDNGADLNTLITQIGTAGDGLTTVPWNSSWDTEVESEVNDALDTAISELGVAAPTATPTLRTGLMLLYMALRNKLVVQTSGTDAIEIYNDAGTLIAKKLITDDTSDYTEAKMSSG